MLLIFKKKHLFFRLIAFSFILYTTTSCATHKVDVLVVGGGAGGTAAGLQAARLGAKTLIAEETPWLGGMLTAAGVSAIDGNHNLPSGIFAEFRDSLIDRYGSAEALKTGWVSNILFEPKVGNEIFRHMTEAEKILDVWTQTSFISASKHKDGWKVRLNSQGKEQTVQTKRLIDATETGDVAAFCGVQYDVGMDARSVSGEAIAPEEANDIIQDLTYVMIIRDYGVDKTIPKPKDYNPALFFCAAKSPNCSNPKPGQTVWPADKMMTYGKLPNGRYMINWPIEGNDFYVNMLEMNKEERAAAIAEAKNFSLCFLYYLQTELGFSTFGPDDEQFPTADNLPLIPYHRESRRIHGLVRFTVNHAKSPYNQPQALYRTGIAVGDYPVDHHHKRYPDWEKLPELHFYPIPSYNVPLGALIPQDTENLIVAEKSISVSNIMNGSTRLQPVVLQAGQAAGALAAVSLKTGTCISQTPVREVQKVLLENGVYLMPYLDLPAGHPHFKAIQRIGATGILKGEGKNVGWSNQTWFNTEKPVLTAELKAGLKDFEADFHWETENDSLTTRQAVELVNRLAKFYQKDILNIDDIQSIRNRTGLPDFTYNRLITRLEMAVLLDALIDPFSIKHIDFTGKYKS